MRETRSFSFVVPDRNDEHTRKYGVSKEAHEEARKNREKRGFARYQNSGAQDGDYVQVRSRFEGQPIGMIEGQVREDIDKSGRITQIFVDNLRIRFRNLDSIKLLK